MNRNTTWKSFKNTARQLLAEEPQLPPGAQRNREQAVRGILGGLLELLPDEWPLRELRYEEVIRYFVAERPDDPRVRYGAITRRKTAEGLTVSLFFLDDAQSPVLSLDGQPYGREFRNCRLDQELTEAFGTSDLIIVE